MTVERYLGTFAFVDNSVYRLWNPTTDARADIARVGDLEESISNVRQELISSAVIFDTLDQYRNTSEFFGSYARTSGKVLDIVETSSYKCNLRCVYCFEQDTLKTSSQTPRERVSLYKKLLQATKTSKLSLTLFGGEPFLNMDWLKELIHLCDGSDGIDLAYFGAVTNGTLFTDRVIEFMQDPRFISVQITIDGPENLHNSRRVSRSINSFAESVNGIRRALTETNCIVYFNTVLDRSNTGLYRQMVTDFVDEFGDYCFGDDARLVFNLGNECQTSKGNSLISQNALNIENELKSYLDHLEWLLDSGLTVHSPGGTGYCLRDSFTGLVLSPEGSVYNCISGVGVDEFKVADYDQIVADPLAFTISQISRSGRPRFAGCYKCEYFAMCNGGCSYEKYTEGAYSSCQRHIFDANLEQFIRLKTSIRETKIGHYRKRALDSK